MLSCPLQSSYHIYVFVYREKYIENQIIIIISLMQFWAHFSLFVECVAVACVENKPPCTKKNIGKSVKVIFTSARFFLSSYPFVVLSPPAFPLCKAPRFSSLSSLLQFVSLFVLQSFLLKSQQPKTTQHNARVSSRTQLFVSSRIAPLNRTRCELVLVCVCVLV